MPLYPPTFAQLTQLPGYVPDLHARSHEVRVCNLCAKPWPCDGALEQCVQMLPVTSEFWLLPQDEFIKHCGRGVYPKPTPP